MKRKIQIVAFSLAVCLFGLWGCQKSDNNKKGIEYYNNGAYGEAAVSFQAAIVEDNTEPQYYVNQGMNYIEMKDFVGAHQSFDNALRAHPGDKYAYRGKGIAFFMEGKYEEALEAFQNALSNANGKVGETELDILMYRADTEAALGDYEAALETYTILLDVEKKEVADYYYLRGSIYAKMGDIEKAKADFDKAIQNKPQEYGLYWKVYDVLVLAGAEEDGRNYLNDALVIKSEDTAGHKNRGITQYLLGDYDSAVTELNAIRESGDVETLLYLGRAYEALEDGESAFSVYSTALTLTGGSAHVYNQMGMYKMRTGEYSEALNYFQQGIATGEEDLADLYYNEAVVYEYLGDFQTAREKLQAYSDTYGSNEEIEHELQFLSTR